MVRALTETVRTATGRAAARLGHALGLGTAPPEDDPDAAADVAQDHKLGRRDALVAAAQDAPSALEIGPFHNPSLTGENVAYFDLQRQPELIARVAEYGLPTDRVPHIDFADPKGDLSGIDRRFAAVFSSHCIEHQPSLVRHLTQVSALLEPGGRYYLIAPDKRFCFDHYLPLSTLGGVIEAHLEDRRIHSLANLIDARTLVTHNQKLRHWTADHGDYPTAGHVQYTARHAIDEYRAADGAYIDIHAWRFTPGRFCEIITALHQLDFTDLGPELVCATRPGQLEFTAVLRKPG